MLPEKNGFCSPKTWFLSDFHPQDIDTLHSYFQPKTSGRSEGRPTTPGSSGRGSMVGTPRAVFTDSVARMGLEMGCAWGWGNGWLGWLGWKQIIWIKLLKIEICFCLKLLDWNFLNQKRLGCSFIVFHDFAWLRRIFAFFGSFKPSSWGAYPTFWESSSSCSCDGLSGTYTKPNDCCSLKVSYTFLPSF